MNYRSSKETAELWNLTSRRVSLLASNGRIPGAKLVGKTWLIPEDAKKPDDARFKKTDNIYKEEYYFPLLTFLYNSIESAGKKLSQNQLELFKAQRLCISGNFEEADILLTKLLENSNNICTTLGVLYFKIFTDIFLNNQISLHNTYTKIQQIDLSKYENREELSLIILDMKGILTGNKVYLENFKINRNYTYSNESLPYLVLLETYTSLISAYTSGEALKPLFQESACIFMKQNNYTFSEITMNLYLAMMYKTTSDNENYLFHIHKALMLAEENEIILPFIIGFKYLQNEIRNFEKESRSPVFKKISETSEIFYINSNKFYQNINISKIFYTLNADELKLIENARLGLTNKEIAKQENISESYVSKKYFLLCKKTGVSTKKELVDLYLENMKL